MLARAAKIGQPFARPVRTYRELDIRPEEHPRRDYQPIRAMRWVLERKLMIDLSTVKAGMCAELWFPDRTLSEKPKRLPVYVFEMRDGSVRANAGGRRRMCWQ